jgi:hypothetical protein
MQYDKEEFNFELRKNNIEDYRAEILNEGIGIIILSDAANSLHTDSMALHSDEGIPRRE